MRRSKGYVRAGLVALGLLVLAPAVEAVLAVDVGHAESQTTFAALD
ncbi:MAG: hypothetical protein INR62_08455 [Rhodospirillales bacterium]|nr:hypothetical protein [Acetobacter sp.]